MQSFKEIMITFENFLQSYDTSIISSFHPHFEDAFFKMLKVGGKRLRPSLLLSIVYEKMKDKIIDSFDIALAIEVLHTYSLIHDDLPIMDNAYLRRGVKTLHIEYDSTTATLIGDALNTYAFYLIANSKLQDEIKVKLIHSLSFNATKMVLGQAIDCYFENEVLSKEKLDFIHTNKTARLIASSLEMGAIISNLPDDKIKDLYNFGMLLGLFFQIRDDIIDKTKNNLEAGKTTNNDKNKNSYINLLGLEATILEQNHIKSIIKTQLNNIDKDISNILYLIIKKLFTT